MLNAARPYPPPFQIPIATDPRCSYLISVKTQFGSIETHIWIVGLLRYLKSKYFAKLTVHDEGGYWETGDAEDLAGKREFLGSVLDRLEGGLATDRQERGSPNSGVIDEYWHDTL